MIPFPLPDVLSIADLYNIAHIHFLSLELLISRWQESCTRLHSKIIYFSDAKDKDRKGRLLLPNELMETSPKEYGKTARSTKNPGDNRESWAKVSTHGSLSDDGTEPFNPLGEKTAPSPYPLGATEISLARRLHR